MLSTDTKTGSVNHKNVITDQLYSDDKESHKTANHPVHIFDNTQKKLSPSSFIPFCDFGGNKEAMGVKIDKYQQPVCNSFEARILNDQLCYEIDPNGLGVVGSDSFSKGLTLFIDNNVERMYPKRISAGLYNKNIQKLFLKRSKRTRPGIDRVKPYV